MAKKNDDKDIKVEHEELSNIENLIMKIQKKLNSIGIIDGQHRIFAHYEADILKDKYESIIVKKRQDNHLLVTGLLFPKSMRFNDRIKFESELFLQINSTQKSPDPALLQGIRALHEPYSPIGIARNVLINLNQRSPFLGLMQIFPSEKNKIRTSSLVKWGLMDLVEISNDKTTLFKYWDNNRKVILLRQDEDSADFDSVFNKYIDFCSSRIAQYFNALKHYHKESWKIDRKNKLLTVTPLTAFLISLRQSLEIYEKVGDFMFYKEKLKNVSDINFATDDFKKYYSSHWHEFANEISKRCWNKPK